MTDFQDYGGSEDRTLPAVIYALYVVGLTHGLTIFIGLIMAYACRGGAGPVMWSHYTFLIRTFWISIGWFVVGAVLMFWGGIFSVILVGLPFLALGGIIFGLVWLWFLIRCIQGVVLLARGEPHPKPLTWMF